MFGFECSKNNIQRCVAVKFYHSEEAQLLPTYLLRKYVFLDSSMVEHSAVNRVVVGSSPTRGVFS